MKNYGKLMSVFIALTFAATGASPLSLTACGQKGTEGLEYIELDDGTYAVSGGNTENLRQIEIPSTFKGKAVTKIFDGAFLNYEHLYSIVIPSSVIDIGEEAFKGCSGLVEVNIPGGVTCIEDGTFADCRKLENISIPNSVTKIGANAFASCVSLTEMTIPDSVVKIGKYAFA